ncbi:MAG: hypothetical protein IKQ46_10460 [Bacteroidales bacterium]|nr:hypothetical protein [Bacteroidales bacterium]
MITLNDTKEINKYYNKITNTYDFKNSDGKYLDIEINFDLITNASIISHDIIAKNIIVKDIVALNIKAQNIISEDIRAYDIFSCDIRAHSILANNMKSLDINAHNIKANNITALDIKSLLDIYANNITFYGVCLAYKDIVCNRIKGTRKNSKYFTLDGDIIIRKGNINDR